MPRLLRSAQEFLSLLPKASECRVVRRENKVKLKLRLKRMIYAYVTDEAEAKSLLEKVNIPKVEF